MVYSEMQTKVYALGKGWGFKKGSTISINSVRRGLGNYTHAMADGQLYKLQKVEGKKGTFKLV